MDAGRVASLYIRGVESFLPDNDIAFTLTFRQPFDADHLLAGFGSLIRDRAGLRVRLEPVGQTFDWVPLTDSEVETGLASQREHFGKTFTIEEVLSQPLPPDQLLAARITRVDTQCVIFQTRHVLANGISTLHWIEEWLAVSTSSGGALTDHKSSATRLAAKRDSTQNVAIGLFWLVSYLAEFLVRAGWRSGQHTVDLTHGRSPAPRKSGFHVKTYKFRPEQTEQILERSRSLGLTVSQAVCAAMASAMLSAQPDKSRVCISVPTDLGSFVPGISRLTPGNYTGSIIVQVRRGPEPGRQVQRAFRWLKHGIDYWLTRTLGAFSQSERKLSESFARAASLPISSRSPFENLSCAVSSVGTIRLPLIQKHIGSISATGRTQTILVCVMKLNDCMSIEVSASQDLFDGKEVFAVTDHAVALLGASQKL